MPTTESLRHRFHDWLSILLRCTRSKGTANGAGVLEVSQILIPHSYIFLHEAQSGELFQEPKKFGL